MSTHRFTDRADDYERARPGYPTSAIDALCHILRLSKGSTLADLGAGTGRLTEPFLNLGCEVWAVEPNADMAAVAEARWAEHAHFHSVVASAEATGLKAHSVDAVVCAQAFHWFDPEAAARECHRILTPFGGVALVWNRRRLTETPFLEAYEAFLHRWGRDYAKVAATYESESSMQPIFQGAIPDPRSFDNRQRLNEAGLLARIQSCSYMPKIGEPTYPQMAAALKALFATHQQDNVVELRYDTVVYAKRLELETSP